jgi:predicted GNAT family acetyltransferase
MSESTPNVVHDPAALRYAIFIGDEEVGHLEYSQMVNEIHFTHTFVNPAHQGKNLAAILTKFALDDVRAEGKHKVVPVCSYTVRYMEKHPDTQDLLLNPIEDAVAMCKLPNVAKASEKMGLNPPA